MKTNQIIIVVLVAVVALGGGFFGGMQYQQSQTSSRSGQYTMMGGNGRTGFGGRMMGQNGGRTVGDVVSIDTNSITIKLPDGSSKIVVTSGSTQVGEFTKGSLSDVKAGNRIVVFGSQNSDGSMTAQNIQINPVQPSPSQPAGK